LKVGDVSGIGVGKISQLNGYGIFTAADINYPSIIRLSGFGEAAASGLTAWKAKVERTFQPVVVTDDQHEIDLLALEVLKSTKAELQKEQRDIKLNIDRILKDAKQAAGEAVTIQDLINELSANLLAIKAAVPEIF
jgi:hypothetical protein